MAAAPFLTDLPVETPENGGAHFDEPVVQPLLAKHSPWYRRHSKTHQRATEADHATQSQRSSSSASEHTESAAPAPSTATESAGQGSKPAEPLAKEERKRRSSVVRALRWAFWYNGNN